MNGNTENDNRPIFYTVREAARIMRCNPSTLYRTIRENSFPAVRVRTRYVVQAAAVDKLATGAAELGGCVDVARMASDRRTTRDVARLTGGAPW